MFSELISESHKLALLRANFRKSSEDHHWSPHYTSCSYRKTMTQQPAWLAANPQHLFLHHRAADTSRPALVSSSNRHQQTRSSFTKQQTPALPSNKHLYFLLQQTRSCKSTLDHRQQFCTSTLRPHRHTPG